MAHSRYGISLVWIALALVITGCAAAVTGLPATPESAPTKVTPTEPTQPEAKAAETAVPEPAMQPTEQIEYTWSQLLRPDDILPIYDPKFVPASEAGYSDTELVMGVEIDGQAKAYPVGLLNWREMVNDELAGIPILVTW